MNDNWADAMVELNGALEGAKEAGVTIEEALQEVRNVYSEE